GLRHRGLTGALVAGGVVRADAGEAGAAGRAAAAARARRGADDDAGLRVARAGETLPAIRELGARGARDRRRRAGPARARRRDRAESRLALTRERADRAVRQRAERLLAGGGDVQVIHEIGAGPRGAGLRAALGVRGVIAVRGRGERRGAVRLLARLAGRLVAVADLHRRRRAGLKPRAARVSDVAARLIGAHAGAAAAGRRGEHQNDHRGSPDSMPIEKHLQAPRVARVGERPTSMWEVKRPLTAAAGRRALEEELALAGVLGQRGGALELDA